MLNGSYELLLPKPVDQIDILIAHFGQAPTLKGYGRKSQLVETAADDRPRQAELLRLLGQGIDRVTIDAPAEAVLVQISFPSHTRGGRPPNEFKQRKRASKRTLKKS